MKLLWETIRKIPQDIGIDNFLKRTLISQEIMVRVGKWDYIKLKVSA
jgi:hypothetical protein